MLDNFMFLCNTKICNAASYNMLPNFQSMETINMDFGELRTKAETAKILRISIATLDRRISTHSIEFYRVGWQILFSREQIQNYLLKDENKLIKRKRTHQQSQLKNLQMKKARKRFLASKNAEELLLSASFFDSHLVISPMNIIPKNKTKIKSFPPLLTELILAYIDDCKNIGVVALDVRAILSMFGVAYQQELIKKALYELANSRKIYMKVGGSQNVFIIIDTTSKTIGN